MNKCDCGNKGCLVCWARVLTPFCLWARSPAPRGDAGFSSYGAAAAVRKDGQKVLRVGNFMDGGRKRFVLVAA